MKMVINIGILLLFSSSLVFAECATGYKGRECRHNERLERIDKLFFETIKLVRTVKQSKVVKDKIKWLDNIETTFPYLYWSEVPFGYDELKTWEVSVVTSPSSTSSVESKAPSIFEKLFGKHDKENDSEESATDGKNNVSDNGEEHGNNDVSDNSDEPSKYDDSDNVAKPPVKDKKLPIITLKYPTELQPSPKSHEKDLTKLSSGLEVKIQNETRENEVGTKTERGKHETRKNEEGAQIERGKQEIPILKPATDIQIEHIASCLTSNSKNCLEVKGNTASKNDPQAKDKLKQSLQVVQFPLCKFTIEYLDNLKKFKASKLKKLKDACRKNGHLFSAYKINEYYVTRIEGGIDELNILTIALEKIKDTFLLKAKSENDFVFIKGSSDYLQFKKKPKLPVSPNTLKTCIVTNGKIEYKTIDPQKISKDIDDDFLMDNEMLAYVRAYMVKEYLTKNIGIIDESTKVCLYGENKPYSGDKHEKGKPEDRAVSIFLVRQQPIVGDKHDN